MCFGFESSMNIHSLIQMIILLDECRKVEDLFRNWEAGVTIYGFGFYSLIQHSRLAEESHQIVLGEKWPVGWSQLYSAKRFSLVDPVLRYLSHAQRPFRWSESRLAMRRKAYSRRLERMIADAASYGLHDGYVFPIYGRQGLLAHMTVCGKPVELSPAETALFDAAARTAFWRLMRLKGEVEDLDGASPDDAHLTRREMEILRYLADGMTSGEISQILKISAHTVDWYMNGLQTKLNAKNRQQAVARAFRNGLLT